MNPGLFIPLARGGAWSRYKESEELMRGEIPAALDKCRPGWIMARLNGAP